MLHLGIGIMVPKISVITAAPQLRLMAVLWGHNHWGFHCDCGATDTEVNIRIVILHAQVNSITLV